MEDDEFESALKEYLKPVYNFLFRLTGDAYVAEDLTQETFLKAWKNRKKFEPSKGMKPWLFTIARNTAFDNFRKRKDMHFSELDTEEYMFEQTLPDLSPLPDEIFSRAELASDLEKAVSRLNPRSKEVVLLHYLGDLTFEEIARAVGKSMNTVKSLHRRALHQIRELLRIL